MILKWLMMLIAVMGLVILVTATVFIWLYSYWWLGVLGIVAIVDYSMAIFWHKPLFKPGRYAQFAFGVHKDDGYL